MTARLLKGVVDFAFVVGKICRALNWKSLSAPSLCFEATPDCPS